MDCLNEKDLDEMDLLGLLDFVDWRNSYKEMMNSYEDIVAELREECRREEEQLRYLEEKEKENV